MIDSLVCVQVVPVWSPVNPEGALPEMGIMRGVASGFDYTIVHLLFIWREKAMAH